MYDDIFLHNIYHTTVLMLSWHICFVISLTWLSFSRHTNIMSVHKYSPRGESLWWRRSYDTHFYRRGSDYPRTVPVSARSLLYCTDRSFSVQSYQPVMESSTTITSTDGNAEMNDSPPTRRAALTSINKRKTREWTIPNCNWVLGPKHIITLLK